MPRSLAGRYLRAISRQQVHPFSYRRDITAAVLAALTAGTRTFSFSNYRWFAKSFYAERVGPGNSPFAYQNVRTDQANALELSVKSTGETPVGGAPPFHKNPIQAILDTTPFEYYTLSVHPEVNLGTEPVTLLNETTPARVSQGTPAARGFQSAQHTTGGGYVTGTNPGAHPTTRSTGAWVYIDSTVTVTGNKIVPFFSDGDNPESFPARSFISSGSFAML